jgi:hypothetical protein
MFQKKHVRNQLYDYLSGGLTKEESSAVENHLADCPQCSEERQKVEEAIKAINSGQHDLPTLPESYWAGYWKAIEARLKTSESRPSVVERLLDLLRARETERFLSPKIAYGLLGFVLGAIATFGVLSPYINKGHQTELTRPAAEQAEAQPAEAESPTLSSITQEISQPLIQFFQKAKAFLIAVKNVDESKETPSDLVSQQETSKRLGAECRNLKRLPLDPREQQLLSELDVVLVQLSKVKNEKDSLKLDLVKEGIERNNLVMRIRVHELAHEVRLLQATQAGSAGSNSF